MSASSVASLLRASPLYLYSRRSLLLLLPTHLPTPAATTSTLAVASNCSQAPTPSHQYRLVHAVSFNPHRTMFLFRHSAEPKENDEAHHDPVDNAIKQEETALAAPEEHKASAEMAGNDALHEVSSSADSYESPESARNPSREGTVPPPDLGDMMEHPYQHHEDDVEADVAATVPATSAPMPANGISTLPMPRTYNAAPPTAVNGNGVQRHDSHSYNSRGAAPSPRSTSGISRGRSYSLSGLSAAELADVYDQQYRRCSSVVRSARSLVARRASSVNGVVGVMDGFGTSASSRGSPMTEEERIAVERMMENEYRRQEVAERMTQYALARESIIVKEELAREKATYMRRMHMDAELHARLEKSGRNRQERMAAAAQRRQEHEQERLRILYDSMAEKDSRYHFHNPYAMMAAQRRYSVEVRHSVSITPQRRASSPFTIKRNGNSLTSPRTNEEVTNGNTDDRRTSSPVTRARSTNPRIDQSKPLKCLPLDAWKVPEQPRKKSPKRDSSTARRALSPKAWRAAVVPDHPRHWH
ncbi:conserved hypothetical protein [Leishmania braziliensis MHOM/BR/75/M2904]|uniref:Uncharacterized protein n=2 Tax=Leishmania braziliensis TaxID=5660 RepID=A4H5T9_LEIBR|nr:conserved hypothetical protein [Leishmania braziliensis MHOM/BR/75/M2904]CAJ2467564.1 unnamed protein product [Leishmania braziliensis]CAM41855.1 conserved hypothetical protein [Leishmania braziliensis MHOM/BR/75/M2904]